MQLLVAACQPRGRERTFGGFKVTLLGPRHLGLRLV